MWWSVELSPDLAVFQDDHEIACRHMGLFLEGILGERGNYEESTGEAYVLAKGRSLDIFLGNFFRRTMPFRTGLLFIRNHIATFAKLWRKESSVEILKILLLLLR